MTNDIDNYGGEPDEIGRLLRERVARHQAPARLRVAVVETLSPSEGHRRPSLWLPPALSAVQSGQLRALGVAANERAAGMPDVPTFAEQGVNDQEADTLTGIVAPAATPKEVVDLLYRETATAVRQPEVSERLKVLGFKAVVNTPDEFGARIKLEIEKWSKVVRNAKLRID